MPPIFLLAHLYAEGSLPRFAHRALPGAPVRRSPPRRHRR
jgi:hypothetical protein